MCSGVLPVCLCPYHVCAVPAEACRGHQIPLCELLCRSWESNPIPREEQPMNALNLGDSGSQTS